MWLNKMSSLNIISILLVYNQNLYLSQNALIILTIIILNKPLIIYYISLYNIQYKYNNNKLLSNSFIFKIWKNYNYITKCSIIPWSLI